MCQKAVIVHPRFRHTLPILRSNGSLQDLDVHSLSIVAQHVGQDARDLLRFEQVSRMCRKAARDEDLWRHLCRSKFAVPDDVEPSSWRELYRWNHEFFHKVILSYATDRLMQARLNGLGSGAAFNIPVLA